MYDITGKLLCCVGAGGIICSVIRTGNVNSSTFRFTIQYELNHMLHSLLYDFSAKAEAFILKCIL